MLRHQPESLRVKAHTLQVLPNAQRELQALQLNSLISLFSLVIPDLIVVVEHHLVRRLAGLHTAPLSLHNSTGTPSFRLHDVTHAYFATKLSLAKARATAGHMEVVEHWMHDHANIGTREVRSPASM